MAGEYSHIGGLPPAGRLTVALSSGAGLSQLAIDLVAARESLEPITTAYPVCVVITSFNCFQLARCAAVRSLFWTQGQIQSKPPTFRFLYGGHQVKLFFVLHFYPLNWIGAVDVIIVLTPLSLRENTELTSIHYFFSCTRCCWSLPAVQRQRRSYTPEQVRTHIHTFRPAFPHDLRALRLWQEVVVSRETLLYAESTQWGQSGLQTLLRRLHSSLYYSSIITRAHVLVVSSHVGTVYFFGLPPNCWQLHLIELRFLCVFNIHFCGVSGTFIEMYTEKMNGLWTFGQTDKNCEVNQFWILGIFHCFHIWKPKCTM